MDTGSHQPWGLMVQCADLVQIDMTLNLNQRLCGLLMVWKVIENGLDDVSLMT